MGGKKGDSKGKGKESQAAPLSEEVWKKSKCNQVDLQALVDEGLLQPREIVQWWPAEEDVRPYEHAEEIFLFQQFIERGLGLPASDLLHGLLF
jgi:hypothetical protein